MADDQATEQPRPPYISFTTFINFLDRLGDGPMPPRIDKGYLDNYSGGTQAILLVTLRSMEFIDSEGRVERALAEAATDQKARVAILRQWVDRFYAEQQALAGQNGTAQQLWESFSQFGIKGSTLRKAVVFYLGIVEYTGAATSPHFRPPRQASASPSRRRRPEPAAAEQTPVPSPPPPPTVGETIVVDVEGAGTVTLAVDVRWLELSDGAFAALRKLTKDVRALAAPNGSEPASGDSPS